MTKRTKITAGIMFLLLFAGTIVNYYRVIYSSNVKKTSCIYIPTGTTIIGLKEILAPHLENVDDFIWVADKKKYAKRIKPGKFKLTQNMNSNDLVDMLRIGKQTPIKLTFNNEHSLENLAGRISRQIEADSLTLLEAFQDKEFLKQKNFTEATALAMYIPNSYQFFWNTNAKQFRNRMFREFNSFWNQDRVKKATSKNLTPIQVISLASIVQKETAYIKERPIVAGLYLNRYKNSWPLQSDPTIIFALKQKYGQHYVRKRVLTEDLKIKSPYNTYRNRGIPPGPISMPDISSIDAVLLPKKHNYFFMCASIENFGEHKFAKTLSEHNRNAVKYQRWLSKQGINR